MSREESGTAARLPAATPDDDATDLDRDPADDPAGPGAPPGSDPPPGRRRRQLVATGGAAAVLVGWVLTGGAGVTPAPSPPAPTAGRSAAPGPTGPDGSDPAGDLSVSLTPVTGGRVAAPGQDRQRVTFLLVNQAAAALVVRSVTVEGTAAVRFDGWTPIRVNPGGLASREGTTGMRCAAPVPRVGPPAAGTARMVVTWDGGPEQTVTVPVYGYADRLVGVTCPSPEPGVHVTAVDAAAVGAGRVRVRLVNHGTVSVQVAALTDEVPDGLRVRLEPSLPLDLPPGELRTVTLTLTADCAGIDRRAVRRQGAGLTLEARMANGWASVDDWPVRLLATAATRAAARCR